ncbi:hypothetical protein SAMD00019534_109870, partial [Acytostelium subglobosum LB1]|uniref:hypothetical protein n=1 Tax=Acytostelium subglobosum LB1 TaxID=1410327 RepID=UPI0006451A36
MVETKELTQSMNSAKGVSYDGKVYKKNGKTIVYQANHYRHTSLSRPRSLPPISSGAAGTGATTSTTSTSSTSSTSHTRPYRAQKSITNTSMGNTPQHNGSQAGHSSSETSPNSKSKIKRMSVTVSVSTQKYLEKLRHKESNLDTNDIVDHKQFLHLLKKDFRSVEKTGKPIIDASLKEMSGMLFGEMVKEFGEGALKTTVEGKALRELGEQIMGFEENRLEEVTNGYGGFVEPLYQFFREDLKKTRELKRKQNVLRIRYEQSQSTLHETRKKNDPMSSKTVGAKKEEEESKLNYSTMSKEFAESMKSNKTRLQSDLRRMIKEYAGMQADYYREAMESWEDFCEAMESMIPEGDDDDAHEHRMPTGKSSLAKKKKNDDDSDEDDDDDNDDHLLDSDDD